MQSHLLIYLNALIIFVFIKTVVRGDAVECDLTDTADNSTCHCKKLQSADTPWYGNGARTAPSPRNISLDFFNHNGEILPVISWTVSGQYLEHITGFYIQTTLQYSAHFYFACFYDPDHMQSTSEKHMISLKFKHCCNDLFGGLYPHDSVDVLIMSMPLYVIGDNPYYITAQMDVPENSEALPEYEEEITEDEISRRTDHDSTDDSLIPVFISLAIILLLTILVITILCFRRRRKKPKNGYEFASRVKRILYISDNEEKLIKLYNRIIEATKTSCVGEVEIIANIRKQTEAARSSIVTWTTTNMKKADIVVIMISRPSQLRNVAESNLGSETSIVTVALKVAESEAVHSNFGDLKKRFITLHVGNFFRQADLFPFCSHYVLPEQLKGLLKQLHGNSYDTSFNTQDVNNYIVKEISCIHHTTEYGSPIKESIPSLPTNNLDYSLCDQSSVQLNDLDKPGLYCVVDEIGNNASIEKNESVV